MKVQFYSASNHGRLQSDSEDGFPTRYFTSVRDAKAYAKTMLNHWEDAGESFEIQRHEFDGNLTTREGIVASLNRALPTRRTTIARINWTKPPA